MTTGAIIGISSALLILLFLSATFSAAETAYSTVSMPKIEQDLLAGKRYAKLVKKHYKSYGWTLATILISNNIVNILASSMTTGLLTSLLTDSSMAPLISTVAVTPLVVIFGEITPKVLAKKHALGYLKKVVYLMEFLNYLFFPFTYPLSKLTLSSSVTNTESDIKHLLKLGAKEGVLQRHEATLAAKALDLDSKVVRNIMTKKPEVDKIEKNSKVRDARLIFQETSHSRLPVTENGKYVGVLLFKDIAFKKDTESIEPYIVPLLFISQQKLATKALEIMRENHSHLAAVTDRHNSERVVGIITIEDILEELVGEIYDEHDDLKPIREVNHHKFIANGSASMHNLEDLIKYEFDDIKHDDDITVKQWLQSHINRKIKEGLKYEYKDIITFKVVRNKQKEGTIIEIVTKI